MLCQVCHGAQTGRFICDRCASMLRRAPERLLPGGIRALAAFEHSGPARKLAHHLKYRGLTWYASLVAGVLAPAIPPGVLVPVPRALSRWLRYGVDPARIIAGRLSAITGAPVQEVLVAPLHTTRRAGGDHARRAGPYQVRNSALESVVLIDDVITTGATLGAAADAIGLHRVRAVAAANAVPAITGSRRRR